MFTHHWVRVIGVDTLAVLTELREACISRCAEKEAFVCYNRFRIGVDTLAVLTELREARIIGVCLL